MPRHLLACAFFLYCLSAFTQNQFQYGLKAGLRAGQVDLVTNLEFFAEDANDLFDGIVTFRPQVGFWWSFPLSRRWSVQPELLWSPKSWSDGDLPATQRNPVQFTYFSLPVAFTCRTGNLEMTIGPELSLLLDQRLERLDPSIGTDEHPIIEEQVVELGVNLGVQYHAGRLIVGLRADRDLTQFLDYEFLFGSGQENFLRFYHQGMTLWVGYRL